MEVGRLQRNRRLRPRKIVAEIGEEHLLLRCPLRRRADDKAIFIPATVPSMHTRIGSLRGTLKTDGKAVRNLSKLTLFRQEESWCLLSRLSLLTSTGGWLMQLGRFLVWLSIL